MAKPFSAAQARANRILDWLRSEWGRFVEGKFKIFLKPSVIFVFVLVAAWNGLISGRFLDDPVEPSHSLRKAVVDTLRDLRDTNLNLQMRLYQPITHRAIPLGNDNVSIVYIDDEAHWQKMYGNTPTDRKELAKLILHAAQWRTKASVIGLDVELFLPQGGQEDPDRTQPPPQPMVQSGTSEPAPPCMLQSGPTPGADPKTVPYLMDCDMPDLAKLSDDGALVEAIRFATRHGVPVILASYLYRDHGQEQLPNLFTLSQIGAQGCKGPRCPGFGYINLPEDKRQVPIRQVINVPGVKNPQIVDSFAFKVAKAAKGRDDILKNPKHANPGAEVFGTFLHESAFEASRIDFESLSNGSPDAKDKCSDRVVLIGGRWHGEQGYGEPVDQHLSPAGDISGVALHATYIEALLAHQISREWPFWVNFSFDIALGLAIFYGFETIEDSRSKTKWLRRWALVPLALAYLSMFFLNKYLDFLFPVELYFVHVLFSILEQRFHKKFDEHKTPAPPGQGLAANP
jgi:CHASE2 domain-containing sensor protein